MFTFRLNYFLLFVTILLVEVFIALYVHDSFIRPFFGDFLASIFVYLGLKSIFSMPVKAAAIFSLLLSYLVETLQYFNFLESSGLHSNKFFRIVLGTSFAWEDILAYTLGIGLVLLVENYTKLKLSK
ncbi:DUF2809 domain-containing protein [uncultured Arcticibacterium sp.]|uniref:ribosomal maturation YjgA family protein n=1 Tax=uncultured Arcticibacterium sp. TaxID=2173042 RepID=UPI0030FA8012